MANALSYARYAETPVVCHHSTPSASWCLRARTRTGAFGRCDRLLRPLWIGTDSDVTPLGSRERFVQELEAFRGRWLTGDGPVFALYQTIRGMEEQAARERRLFTAEERELVRRPRPRTHELFGRELRERGLTGTPEEPDTSRPAPPAGPADGTGRDGRA